MGKKIRRPNRNNKPKDIPAVAAPAVASSPRGQVVASATDVAATFNQLYTSKDWAGMLQLESKISVIANTFESSNPAHACRINFNLGAAHKEIAKRGGH